MIVIRKSADRGKADHGWLQSRHSFSFADYHDEKHMGFGPLRVINEDWIQGGKGFGTHGHRDMEIITYVVDGVLEHRDSMGTLAAIRPGEVQRMSAGTGVQHSEYNQLTDKSTHLLQIWIVPEQRGVAPSYGQKSFATAFASGQPVLVISKSGKEESIAIQQDADMYVCKASGTAGKKDFRLRPHRRIWIQAVHGEIEVAADVGESVSEIDSERDGERDRDAKKNSTARLESGDAAAIERSERVRLAWGEYAEFILFDLP